MNLQHLPNLLSILRIASVPVLMLLAWHGLSSWFTPLLAVALATDALDGFIARTFNLESELGSKLDSWGDAGIYFSFPLCAWWLWPETLSREWLWVAFAVAGYVLPASLGLLKFSQMPNYHTWGSKAAAVAMSFAIFALFVFDLPNWFRAVALFQFAVGLEHCLITLTLDRVRSNIPTYWHARRLKRSL